MSASDGTPKTSERDDRLPPYVVGWCYNFKQPARRSRPLWHYRSRLAELMHEPADWECLGGAFVY